jgi:hypothetical protein
VLPAIAFAQPQETLAVFDPVHFLHDFHPGIIAIGEEHLSRAGPGIACDDLVGVLQPVEVLKHNVPGIFRPFHAGNVVVSRIGAGLEPAGASAADVHDAADARVIIPLSRGRRSFNLTVSAAIGLSEALRQTGRFPAFHPQDFPSHD